MNTGLLSLIPIYDHLRYAYERESGGGRHLLAAHLERRIAL